VSDEVQGYKVTTSQCTEPLLICGGCVSDEVQSYKVTTSQYTEPLLLRVHLLN